MSPERRPSRSAPLLVAPLELTPTLRPLAKRAKRRRRERKREKRQQRPRPQPVLAGATGERSESRTFPGDPPPDDSPGDALARDLRDEPPKGPGVREPRRPKPNAPLAGAAELPL